MKKYLVNCLNNINIYSSTWHTIDVNDLIIYLLIGKFNETMISEFYGID